MSTQERLRRSLTPTAPVPTSGCAVLFCAIVACGSSTSSRPLPDAQMADARDVEAASDAPVSDATVDAPSPPDAAACGTTENDGGTCNSVVPSGALLTPDCPSGAAPQAQGGVVEDGTYVDESYSYYGGCMSQRATATWVICGQHWDFAQATETPNQTTTQLSSLSTVATVTGSTVSFDVTCQSTGLQLGSFPARGFTASPGRLTFIYPVFGGTAVSTYVKQ